jgi:hypothetical protein
LDTLRHAENPEIDDGVEITDAAGERAKEVFKRLSARQVASYLVSAIDEIADPLEEILGALEKVRGLEEKEWKQLREEVSEEVGRLVAGLDAEKAGRIGDRVVQLLIQARALTDEEFKTERMDLEKEARQIVGEIGPLEVLGHTVEQALAELLSNPRLQTALDAVVTK